MVLNAAWYSRAKPSTQSSLGEPWTRDITKNFNEHSHQHHRRCTRRRSSRDGRTIAGLGKSGLRNDCMQILGHGTDLDERIMPNASTRASAKRTSLRCEKQRGTERRPSFGPSRAAPSIACVECKKHYHHALFALRCIATRAGDRHGQSLPNSFPCMPYSR
jgi:hypothetical protein